MMSQIFLKIINMSISASYVVLAVLLLRLLLRKAPKWITVVLWGIVGVRLVCPFSFESALSMIPSAEVVSPDIMTDQAPTVNTGIPAVNQVINPVISGVFSPEPTASTSPLQLWVPILSLLWSVGVAALLVYTVISYVKVKRKVATAVLYKDNIYQSENVVSPFVLGIIKPKIYLPFHISERNMAHVVAHETAHIRRLDHLWKPLGFLLLALHWFNPLMWLGYVLLCRDIELACDEKVIKVLDHDARADYSQALLTCSVNRRMIAACPLAFGEVGVKDRVKSVLSYKKPAFWIIIASVVACVVVAVCFLTNPPSQPKDSSTTPHDDIYTDKMESITDDDNINRKVTLLYYSPIYSAVMDPSAVPTVEIEGNVIYTVSDGYRKQLGRVKEKVLSSADFDAFIIRFGGYDHTLELEKTKKLRENNKITYEIDPDYSLNGVEIYYIMEQLTGEVLIVYGHYENGKKENVIRFIYSVEAE